MTNFALLGFYLALAPSLLQRSLGVESHAVGGAVVLRDYAAAVLVLALTHWLGARAAMLWGLSLLIPSLTLLVVAFQSHSLPLLLIGAALGGGAAALGYRGSLPVVPTRSRQIAAVEVVSSYLMFCYAGVSLPVILRAIDAGPRRGDLRRGHRGHCAPRRSPSTATEPPVTGKNCKDRCRC